MRVTVGLVLAWTTVCCWATVTYLDNGIVRVGVDDSYGGAITFFSDSKNGINMINCYDKGREVQMSYYAGPIPYDGCYWSDSPWPWNPIESGDAYGHSSAVSTITNDGTTIYVKSTPLQWACNKVYCECAFEKWVTLPSGTSYIEVHNKLTNWRNDTTDYGMMDQESPAVYSVGTAYKLYTYQGGAPWTNDTLSQVSNSGPPWAYFTATESWAAQVTDTNFALGIYNPVTTSFCGGFSGTPNKGGPSDPSTGYIAPLQTADLVYNVVYEYDFWLILGNLPDVRSIVYALHKSGK
ncbi:CubicO group peptidase, beta-lactamase class C family [Pelomyxa schiedti]|nr:CubicO group peptidase, beta-lactamase class C family [Pelomyxa schiedti]